MLQLAALLAELRKDHDVRVLALRYADQEEAASDRAAIRCVGVPSTTGRRIAGWAREISGGRPSRWYELASRLAEPLEQELARFRPDVVHVAGALLGSLGRRLAGRAALLAPLDAAHLNAEARASRSAGVRGWLDRRDVPRTQRFESIEYRHFRRIVVVGDADRGALTELDPALDVSVIPNGVDSALFAPCRESAPVRNRVVFAGVMEVAPNVSAAEFLVQEIMPRVRAIVPGAHLVIVGRAPVPAVRRLAREAAVEVVGEVEDMPTWLRSSCVCACPVVSGTGIKNKVLEAMACGVPCVVTPRALNGLAAIPGRHLLVGESADELASSIVRLLQDGPTARELGAAGRAYVVAEHDWRDVAGAYVELYRTLIADARLEGYRSLSQVWSERPPSTGMRAPVT